MQTLDLGAVEDYVSNNISTFHDGRLKSLEGLTLRRLLRKNPYLFRAKNLLSASDVIDSFLDAFLSSSEEEHFGAFLEDLAIFVAQQTAGGHKSTAQGVDLEFLNSNRHYVVSIKSGPNWGNSSQHLRLAQDLQNAVTRVRQSQSNIDVRSVLGICYGKTKTAYHQAGYLKVVGQSFWYLISESKELYTDIVDPIGYQARQHNERYAQEKAGQSNRLTKAFIDTYCTSAGVIDWSRLVQDCCGNYDLDEFL